jgi:N6-adenosine-specific RNA methylase IME4
MKKWGYHLKDFLFWIKFDKEGCLTPGVGKYLDHCVEICLLGIKGRVKELGCSVSMG